MLLLYNKMKHNLAIIAHIFWKKINTIIYNAMYINNLGEYNENIYKKYNRLWEKK